MTTSRNVSGLLEMNPLEVIDPEMAGLVALETERQARKLILIASESICPVAVREALATPFTNVYAEGLPHHLTVGRERDRVLDLARRMTHYRRYANRRFYKGCDYADLVEALAMVRAQELFANERVPPEGIYANVQPLSGAAANNAVYSAFVKPGGKVMGLDLSC